MISFMVCIDVSAGILAASERPACAVESIDPGLSLIVLVDDTLPSFDMLLFAPQLFFLLFCLFPVLVSNLG